MHHIWGAGQGQRLLPLPLPLPLLPHPSLRDVNREACSPGYHRQPSCDQEGIRFCNETDAKARYEVTKPPVPLERAFPPDFVPCKSDFSPPFKLLAFSLAACSDTLWYGKLSRSPFGQRKLTEAKALPGFQSRPDCNVQVESSRGTVLVPPQPNTKLCTPSVLKYLQIPPMSALNIHQNPFERSCDMAGARSSSPPHRSVHVVKASFVGSAPG